MAFSPYEKIKGEYDVVWEATGISAGKKTAGTINKEDCTPGGSLTLKFERQRKKPSRPLGGSV